MKYVAIIDNDGELSEESIEKIKNTLFIGNRSRYCVVDDFPKSLDAIRNEI